MPKKMRKPKRRKSYSRAKGCGRPVSNYLCVRKRGKRRGGRRRK